MSTRYFLFIIGFWLVWALAAGLEVAAPSPEARFRCLLVQSWCTLILLPLEFAFFVEYAGLGKWLTRRRLVWLCLPAVIFALLNSTNAYHHLVWTEILPGAQLIYGRAPLAWLGVGYAMIMWLANLSVLAWCLLRSPAFFAPILLLMAGTTIPRLAFLVAGPQTSSLSPLQLTMLFTNFSALAYFLALFNYRLLRVVPVARDAALAHMTYGMIVLDGENHVVDLNPAARALLGLPPLASAWTRVGHPAAQALGGWWPRLAPLIGALPISQELSVGEGASQRMFDVYSLPLRHAEEWRIGQVFVIHDITAAWRARQQAAQQQWAEAILQEREQLAHELHDGLTQNLAFLNLLVQAAQNNLKAGREEAAQAGLARVDEVSRQTVIETRQLIGNLLAVSLPAEGFYATLRQVVASFELQSGLPAVLEIDQAGGGAASEGEAVGTEAYGAEHGGHEAVLNDPPGLDPAAALQLLRIIQEALANIRKHAQDSSRVCVHIGRENGYVRVAISDDGDGIDPLLLKTARPGNGNGNHFGLRVMRQRADRIGGQIEIHTAPGQGTCIEVRVPVR